MDNINSILASIKSCPIDQAILKEKIESIQKIIDDLHMKKYSNLHIWVPELD